MERRTIPSPFRYAAHCQTEFPEATDVPSKAHLHDPQNIQNLQHLGLSALELKNYSDVMGWFKKVLQLQPNHIPTMLMELNHIGNDGQEIRKDHENIAHVFETP